MCFYDRKRKRKEGKEVIERKKEGMNIEKQEPHKKRKKYN